jgi:hypothetical protein
MLRIARKTVEASTPRRSPAPARVPARWSLDDCTRREPVVDAILGRVVRYVGWRKCMRCGHPFWSEDVQRLRLCTGQPDRRGCRNRQDEGF